MEEEKIKEQLEKVGKRLKFFRKSKGYSNYEQFAYRHNIGRAQYGKYEKGANLQFSTLLRILEALGVSLEEFFSEGFDDRLEDEF